jgi:hypothetical protein
MSHPSRLYPFLRHADRSKAPVLSYAIGNAGSSTASTRSSGEKRATRCSTGDHHGARNDSMRRNHQRGAKTPPEGWGGVPLVGLGCDLGDLGCDLGDVQIDDDRLGFCVGSPPRHLSGREAPATTRPITIHDRDRLIGEKTPSRLIGCFATPNPPGRGSSRTQAALPVRENGAGRSRQIGTSRSHCSRCSWPSFRYRSVGRFGARCY